MKKEEEKKEEEKKEKEESLKGGVRSSVSFSL